MARSIVRSLVSRTPEAGRLAAAAAAIFLPLAASAAPPLKLGDADVVPCGHWEVWTTFDYERYDSERVLTTPRFEVISGILPRMELALETAYVNARHDTDTDGGFGFVALQPKLLLIEEAAATPALSTSLLMEVPFGNSNGPLEWADREWAPSLTLQKHFGPTVLIGQVKGYFDAGGDPLFWRYGLDVMYETNAKLKLLAEIYAERHLEAGRVDELNFRLGFKYRCGSCGKAYLAAGRSLLPAEANRPQFDLSAGVMLEF